MILSIRGILSAFNFGYTKGNFGYFCNGGFRPSDLQVRGGGGHPDAEIEGRGAVLKDIFSALRASVKSKTKGEGGGSSWPLPWIRHCFG